MFSGEKSRFLYQLDFFKEKEHKITYKEVNFDFYNEFKEVDEVIKSDKIYEELILLAEKGLSPSSLIKYIRNPIDFYEEYLLESKHCKIFKN